jgi:hypothetical protein
MTITTTFVTVLRRFKYLAEKVMYSNHYRFKTGSNTSKRYGPEFLLTEDIVLVTINYRVGIFGFLNFEDASLGVPANTGLKDMVMVLKWVQKNISTFSGDPNNVTIFGESAGATSVHYVFGFITFDSRYLYYTIVKIS